MKISLHSDLEGERCIELPFGSGYRADWLDLIDRYHPLPDRYVGLQALPRETQNGILLPSNGRSLDGGSTAERHRPDVITMVAIGPGELRQYAVRGGVYAVRPYGGMRMESGEWFGGLPGTRHWRDEIILEYRNERWEPFGDWVAIRLDAPESKLVFTDLTGHVFSTTGVVERAGDDSQHWVGRQVVLRSNWWDSIGEDQEFLTAGWDKDAEQFVYCRPVSSRMINMIEREVLCPS